MNINEKHFKRSHIILWNYVLNCFLLWQPNDTYYQNYRKKILNEFLEIYNNTSITSVILYVCTFVWGNYTVMNWISQKLLIKPQFV